MAKLGCPCGNPLDNIAYPSRNIYSIISQVELDSVYDCKSTDAFERKFEKVSHEVWKCTQCKRIAIMHNEDNGLTWYAVESVVEGNMRGCGEKF